jgi:hypothetical protein
MASRPRTPATSANRLTEPPFVVVPRIGPGPEVGRIIGAEERAST